MVYTFIFAVSRVNRNTNCIYISLKSDPTRVLKEIKLQGLKVQSAAFFLQVIYEQE